MNDKIKITIAMALHNKNDCLDNTLLSIKKQKNLEDIEYNLVFIDDASVTDPQPIIQRHFSEEKYKLYRNEEPYGFEKLRGQMLNFLSDDVENIVFQSCDVIWYDENLLFKMALAIKNESLQGKVLVPGKILNLSIPTELYKQEQDFFPLLSNLTLDKSLYGEHKKPSYGYLKLLKKSDLKKVLDTRMFNSDGACDMVLREQYPKANIEMVLMDSVVIHQKHAATIYACTSINQCTHPCPIRRQMIKKGLKFPFYIGYYNSRNGRWDDHPSYR